VARPRLSLPLSDIRPMAVESSSYDSRECFNKDALDFFSIEDGGGTEHSGEKRRGPMARTDGDSRVGAGRWTSGRAGSGVGAT
jgi:hypothetical protein